MRQKTIIDGFRNGQRFRFILKPIEGADVGMTITIKQMSDCFATREARIAVWDALLKLSSSRYRSRLYAVDGGMPNGIVTDAKGFRQVQVDLVDE